MKIYGNYKDQSILWCDYTGDGYGDAWPTNCST
jgi:hypothetical protein